MEEVVLIFMELISNNIQSSHSNNKIVEAYRLSTLEK